MAQQAGQTAEHEQIRRPLTRQFEASGDEGQRHGESRLTATHVLAGALDGQKVGGQVRGGQQGGGPSRVMASGCGGEARQAAGLLQTASAGIDRAAPRLHHPVGRIGQVLQEGRTNQGGDSGQGCPGERRTAAGRGANRQNCAIQLVIGRQNQGATDQVGIAINDLPGPRQALMEMQPGPRAGGGIERFVENTGRLKLQGLGVAAA